MTGHGELEQKLVWVLTAWGRRPLAYICCNRSNLTFSLTESLDDGRMLAFCWRAVECGSVDTNGPWPGRIGRRFPQGRPDGTAGQCKTGSHPSLSRLGRRYPTNYTALRGLDFGTGCGWSSELEI